MLYMYQVFIILINFTSDKLIDILKYDIVNTRFKNKI